MHENVISFGTVAERLIGSVYQELATHFPEEGEHRRILNQLAAEELLHGRVMSHLRERNLRAQLHYDFEVVLAAQAAFMDTALEIQRKLRAESLTKEEAIAELAKLERTLAENLFIHLKLVVDTRFKKSVDSLAKESVAHAVILEKLLD